jgi:lipoprotein NlpD
MLSKLPMSFVRLRYALLLVALGLAGGLGGCASGPQRAPIEDRGSRAGTPAPTAAPEPAPRAQPGVEDAGKPGFYTVKPGDTLARIALDHGQNWRDVARWNGIENPNLIEVGQVLRVAAPADSTVGVAKAAPVPAQARPESRPLDPRAAPAPSAAGSAPAVATPVTVPVAPATPPTAPVREADDDINWLWPAAGSVVSGFDEARNAKGLAIGGKAGDPVLAAADGRVVYAGSGLRGYGNLVIVKHNATYLTAYAHNQALLVKEDQVVRRGQKIAEMGSSDADRVQLHFEIRRLGKPIDPSKLLPPR